MLSLHRAIGIQEQDIHRTAVGTAVIVVASPNHNIDNTIAIHVTDGGDRRAEVVGVVQRTRQPTLGRADLLLGGHGQSRRAE